MKRLDLFKDPIGWLLETFLIYLLAAGGTGVLFIVVSFIYSRVS